MLQLTLLLTPGLLSLCVAEVFHVTPTLPAAQFCPPPCHTLDQYAQNTSMFAGHTNTSLIFLEGIHNLSYYLSFKFLYSRDQVLMFQGQGAVPGDTVITLLPSANIGLRNIKHLKLVNIQMKQHSIQQQRYPTIYISNMQILS